MYVDQLKYHPNLKSPKEENINLKILMTKSDSNIRHIPRLYMVNCKINGKFSGKEEVTGLICLRRLHSNFLH